MSPSQLLAGSGAWLEAGWRHATIDEACALFDSYLLSPAPCPSNLVHFASLSTEVAQFFELFGVTLLTEEGVYVAEGFLSSGERNPGLFGRGFVGNEQASFQIMGVPGVDLYGVADHAGPGTHSSPSIGNFLVRPIPEPTPAPLVLLGLAWLARRRTVAATRCSVSKHPCSGILARPHPQ